MGNKASTNSTSAFSENRGNCSNCFSPINVLEFPCKSVICSNCYGNMERVANARNATIVKCGECNKHHEEPYDGYPVPEEIFLDSTRAEKGDTEKANAAANRLVKTCQMKVSDILNETARQVKDHLPNMSAEDKERATRILNDLWIKVSIFITQMFDAIKRRLIKTVEWFKEKVERFGKFITDEVAKLKLGFK
ncbi:uncharacterized protein [Watersipora subatra]|uniref:uncharacterized protein n=1 Tax=Watersipora subatra TaxID=2589382 RepID=UPI00355C4702